MAKNAALRSVRGRPGEYYNEITGETLKITELREGDIYDSILLPAGLIAAGTQFTFFQNLVNKTILDTNMPTPQRLAAGTEMLVTRFGIMPQSVVGNTFVTPSTTKQVLECTLFELQINRKTVAQGPSIMFPPGYGIYGNSVETNQGIVSNGMPSSAATQNLKRPELLNDKYDVIAYLTFPARTWITAALGFAGVVQPTLAQAAVVKCILHGLIKDAATR